jgi:murein L,D-transpeptidase YafK
VAADEWRKTAQSFRIERPAGQKTPMRRTVTHKLILIAGLGLALVFFGWSGAKASIDPSTKADKVVVFKGKRVLILLRDGEILKTYRIALGRQPKGHKTKVGDNKTPEGTYILDARNPNSNYHLSIRISYPNETDLLNAQRLGVTPGGDIMIHGLSNGTRKLEKYHRYLNWTNGCIAVTDREMEEIWNLVPDGTPIEIKP